MRKVRTSSVKSSSTLFSCLIRAMYNRVNRYQKKLLVLNSYPPGMNTSIFPKRNDENIFSEKLVYELHTWIENHSCAIYPPQYTRLIIRQNQWYFCKET